MKSGSSVRHVGPRTSVVGPRTRRDFLRLASAAGLATVFAAPRVSRERQRAGRPLLETIDPSASGITWMHENAMSPNRYLPETMGPGVALFDYDHHGWLGVF